MPSNDGPRRLLTEEPGVDLKACPFCAASDVSFYEHVYAQHFAVKCNLCGAEGPQRSSHEEAGRMWNRRMQA